MASTAVEPVHRSGHGSPLVLLHGLSLSWRSWQPVMGLLASRHEVFAPSLAGHHGALPVDPSATLSVQGLTDAVELQLDESGIDTTHVAGNSLGGWVALELARRGRARSVTALSPAGGWARERDLKRVLRMARLGWAMSHHPLAGVLASRPRARRALMRPVLERGDTLTGAEARQLLEDNLRCTGLRELLKAIKRDGPLTPLSAPDCLIRIAWSENDRTIPFPTYGHPLSRAIPDAEFLTLLGVGHVPMHDDPQLVAETILNVTSRVDSSASVVPSTRRTLREKLHAWFRRTATETRTDDGDTRPPTTANDPAEGASPMRTGAPAAGNSVATISATGAL